MKDYLHVVIAKGRTYHYFRPSGRLARNKFPAVRLSDDADTARAQASLLAELRQEAGHGELCDHMALLIKEGRRRAKVKGLAFTLTERQALRIMNDQRNVCAVSGLPFDLDDLGGKEAAFRRPFRPSLDRIDNDGGYFAENIRIVCCAVNLAINEWGLQTFLQVAEAVVARNSAGTFNGKRKGKCVPDTGEHKGLSA